MVNPANEERAVAVPQKRPLQQSKAKAEKDKAALEALYAKCERATPKSTARHPLYEDFGKKKELLDDAGAGLFAETSALCIQRNLNDRPHARKGNQGTSPENYKESRFYSPIETKSKLHGWLYI